MNSPSRRKNNSNEVDEDEEEEEEIYQLINITIYDIHASSTILRVNRTISAKDIVKVLAHKLDLVREVIQYHTLVLTTAVYDPSKRSTVHCIKTFNNEDLVLNTMDSFIGKLIEKYQVSDVNKLKNSIRWFFKDVRTSPLEFGDSLDSVGEYSSDEEDELTHSDLAYLVKAERKGYLLKRSKHDQNLWKRWYCVLTDHLWCIDANRSIPKAICVRLAGMMRQKTDQIPMDNLQNIIIHTPKCTHFLRAFNIIEQRKWIEDLNLKTMFASDNDVFNMAEVIINDEELSKSRRYHKQINQIIQIPSVYESICTDYRYIHSIELNVDIPLNGPPETSEEELPLPPSPLSPLSPPQTSPKTINNPTNNANNNAEISSSMVKSQYGNAVPMDRTLPHATLHTLHHHEIILSSILKFMLDVLEYKELFRHDLFTSITQQRQQAYLIYQRYIQPQLDPSKGGFLLYNIFHMKALNKTTNTTTKTTTSTKNTSKTTNNTTIDTTSNTNLSLCNPCTPSLPTKLLLGREVGRFRLAQNPIDWGIPYEKLMVIFDYLHNPSVATPLSTRYTNNEGDETHREEETQELQSRLTQLTIQTIASTSISNNPTPRIKSRTTSFSTNTATTTSTITTGTSNPPSNTTTTSWLWSSFGFSGETAPKQESKSIIVNNNNVSIKLSRENTLTNNNNTNNATNKVDENIPLFHPLPDLYDDLTNYLLEQLKQESVLSTSSSFSTISSSIPP